VPEKYNLKLPEGSLLEPSHLERIAAEAKQRGLSEHDAQKLLERDHQAYAGFVESQQKALATQVTAWSEAAQKDTEIGGEAFAQNAELAKRVVSRFATEQFRKDLEVTGFGNHPELVRVFARIGKAMSDDQLVLPGSQGNTAKKSIEDVFYGGSATQ
jgi:hypothetical protein